MHPVYIYLNKQYILLFQEGSNPSISFNSYQSRINFTSIHPLTFSKFDRGQKFCEAKLKYIEVYLFATYNIYIYLLFVQMHSVGHLLNTKEGITCQHNKHTSYRLLSKYIKISVSSFIKKYYIIIDLQWILPINPLQLMMSEIPRMCVEL